MTDWIKFCSGGDCPDGRVEIRDSARQAEVAWFTQESWETFVDALKAGMFDCLRSGR